MIVNQKNSSIRSIAIDKKCNQLHHKIFRVGLNYLKPLSIDTVTRLFNLDQVPENMLLRVKNLAFIKAYNNRETK